MPHGSWTSPDAFVTNCHARICIGTYGHKHAKFSQSVCQTRYAIFGCEVLIFLRVISSSPQDLFEWALFFCRFHVPFVFSFFVSVTLQCCLLLSLDTWLSKFHVLNETIWAKAQTAIASRWTFGSVVQIHMPPWHSLNELNVLYLSLHSFSHIDSKAFSWLLHSVKDLLMPKTESIQEFFLHLNIAWC